MNNSKLTKEQVINAIHKNKLYFYDLEEKFQNDKDIVLEALKKDIRTIKFISEDFLNDKDILEVLEKCNIKQWNDFTIKWYAEKMEVLNNLRNKEDKEIMEKLITSSKKVQKKNKY